MSFLSRVAAAANGLLGTLLEFARVTVMDNDRVMSYWPLAVALARKGACGTALMGRRSVLFPRMDAICYSLGSDRAYAVCPMLAVPLVGWLCATLLSARWRD